MSRIVEHIKNCRECRPERYPVIIVQGEREPIPRNRKGRVHFCDEAMQIKIEIDRNKRTTNTQGV